LTGVRYLDLEDLVIWIRRLEIGPIRDIGLLDSACSRPRSTLFGIDAYPTLEEKAAALLHSLARNHCLVDGNKRLAWWATTTFLHVNARPVVLDDDTAFRLVMDVAEGMLDVPEIAERLASGGPGG